MSTPGRLSDIFVECLPPAGGTAGLHPAGATVSQCLTIHRVQWLRTLRSADCDRMLCHFRAPDAESVRLVLRRLDLGIGAIWIDGNAAAGARASHSHA
jgi:hypothetical protein